MIARDGWGGCGAALTALATSAVSRPLLKTAGEYRSCERFEVRLARQPGSRGSSRLAALSRSAGASLPRFWRESELRTQPLKTRTLELVKRADLGGHEQFERSIGRHRLRASPSPLRAHALPGAQNRA